MTEVAIAPRAVIAQALGVCDQLRKGKSFGEYPTLVQLMEDLAFIEATLLDGPADGDVKRDLIIARLVGRARALAAKALLETHGGKQ